MSIDTRQIKKETIIATLGIVMLGAVFIFQPGVLQHSSPLALSIIVTVGWLLSLRFELVGSIFLFFGGLALAVHPLLFSSSYWLIPTGALIGFAGFLIFISWWRKNDN